MKTAHKSGKRSVLPHRRKKRHAGSRPHVRAQASAGAPARAHAGARGAPAPASPLLVPPAPRSPPRPPDYWKSPDGRAAAVQFLDGLRAGERHKEALEEAGISWRDISLRLTADPDFARAYADALDGWKRIARMRVWDSMHKRGVDGWERPIVRDGLVVGSERMFSDKLTLALGAAVDPETFGRAASDATGGTRAAVLVTRVVGPSGKDKDK